LVDYRNNEIVMLMFKQRLDTALSDSRDSRPKKPPLPV
jgi:hypothetical protein